MRKVLTCLLLVVFVSVGYNVSAQASHGEILAMSTALCSNCGEEVSKGKFCENCGEKLTIPESTKESQSPMEPSTGYYSNKAYLLKLSLGDSTTAKDDMCIFGKKDSNIYGLDLSLFMSRDHRLYGVGFATLCSYVSEKMGGIQVGGLLNEAGEVYGFQVGGFGNEAGEVYGFQVGGLGNETREVYGFQIGGLINQIETVFRGFQIGILNDAPKDSKGFQFGLVNKIGERFMPIFNMNF